MIEPLQEYNMARFRFYNRRMVEFGIKCGLAMNAMEDSLRQELIDVLSTYTRTNTAIANLLSKHEKTVRNLKRRYKDQSSHVQRQNRMFMVADLVHRKTWRDAAKWLSREHVLDEYFELNPEDVTFDEEVLDDVLSMLVQEGTLVERRLEYSAFYRASEQSIVSSLAAPQAEGVLDVIAAISDSFQNSADRVSEHPESLQQNRFWEWAFEVKDPQVVSEIHQKIREFTGNLLAEYEGQIEEDKPGTGHRMKVITLIGEEA